MAIELYAQSMDEKNIKRRVSQLLTRLIDDLHQRADGRSTDKVVHDTRTHMKRLRALFALLKPGISGKAYRKANQCCRTVAADLSASRDRTVILETLRQLVLDIPDAECRQRLLKPMLAKEQCRDTATDLALSNATQQLTRLREQVDGWSVKAPPKAIQQALLQDYRAGKHFWKCLRTSVVEEDLHAWRKPVKRFYYQMSALFPASKLKTRRRLKALGEALGDLHDLHVLRDYSDAHTELFWHDDLLRLYRVMESREQGLLEQVWQLAAEVYQRPANRYCHSLIEQWSDLDQPKS